MLQKGFGWLLSGTRHMASHKNPDTRAIIQTSIDSSVQGLLVVYLFAAWEEHVKRDIENEWLPEAMLKRLNAFRHIRHSMAHGFNGTRANKCRNEFEDVMVSNKPFPNLTWDNDSIDLSKSQVATDCQIFMHAASTELIQRIANDNRP